LEKESKTLNKINLIKNFLLSLTPDEIEPVVLFLSGKIFPDRENKSLNVSYSIIKDILNKSARQTILIKKEYTLKEIYEIFKRISSESGEGGIQNRKNILLGVFNQLTPIERDILTRIILNELRIGVSEGVVLQAIAKSSKIDLKLVKNAYMCHGNIGEIARIAITEGLVSLRKIQIKVFRPIKPMLAEMALNIKEILKEHTNNTIFEYKYDGIRVQLHKKGTKIKLFTRTLHDITNEFVSLIDNIGHKIRADSIILDGELVALDKDNRPLPFQDLMKKRNELQLSELTYTIYFFDILLVNGTTLLEKPLHFRRKKLTESINGLETAKSLISSNEIEIKKFFQDAINAGHEGIIGKRLDSIYSLGSRKKDWLKLKEEYSLDLTIIAADWGSGRRHNWLSNYHLAVRDNDEFKIVGKTFKGLTDIEFEYMTKRLLELKIQQYKHTVFVRPEIVVEVVFNEVQKSPKYECGYALRFARIKRIREDKSVDEINTLDDLKNLYQTQFKKKGKGV